MKTFNRVNLDDIYTDNSFMDIKKALEKNGFSVVVINDVAKIRKLIETTIPDEAVVGLDDSEIIDELNIPEYLRKNWNVIVDPYQSDIAPEIKKYLLDKIPTTEYYITSTDLITEDGKVVFKNKNNFLSSSLKEKPENVIAFAGTSQIRSNINEVKKEIAGNIENHTVLEISPYGLKPGLIDNYGQMEDYHDFITDQNEKENNFIVVLLAEEHSY